MERILSDYDKKSEEIIKSILDLLDGIPLNQARGILDSVTNYRLLENSVVKVLS
ncbi:hypothetical protein BDD43_3298 [Mucilaginibacter gracilis]|uniref:Uncharacterized protein n=1 Tax=Mucilaginibacter gracilis TaxID=423350 RepID=A0A495J2D6_9SPHI|nr:hypothetical protein [Mucilaginibacter gracilis]RKR83097.1 hypothetical protein BDD43_3298 [Mucilaginibacter gracilis]